MEFNETNFKWLLKGYYRKVDPIVTEAIKREIERADALRWAEEDAVEIPHQEIEKQGTLGHAFGYQCVRFAKGLLQP